MYYSKSRAGVADIDPKVQEPYVTIPGNPPRKVVIDRLKKLYASMNIEDLLQEEGVDYSTAEPSEATWLPLEPYDDSTFDCRLPDEWIEASKINGVQNGLPGLGLYQDKERKVNDWRKVLIYAYNKELNVFEGEWEDNKEKCRLPRLYLLFDAEDKRLFAKRLAAAYRMRAYADALIKYNFFIDNMPIDDLPEPDSEQQNRIMNMALPRKGPVTPEANSIMGEIKLEYARTMNKIIYDKLTTEGDPNLIQYPLILPPDMQSSKPVKYFAMIQIEDNKFADNLSQFFFNTLLIKKEVIQALVDVKTECIGIKDLHVFTLEQNRVYRVDEFKQVQDSHISQIASTLKETWVNKLKDTIKKYFGGVGKGWFNIQETSKETYEFGKLKKLLTRIRLMMEENILEISKQSLYSFVNGIISLIPKFTTVNGAGDVQNTFTESPVEEEQKAEVKEPLFTIDLIIKQGHDLPKYGPDPVKIPKDVLEIFDKGVTELQQISQLEPKVLEGLFKKQTTLFLKAPIRPKSKPDASLNPDKMVDENMWVWELFDKLETELNRSIEPLQAYLKTYEKYKDLSSLNPDEFVQKVNNASDKEAGEKDLRKEIFDIKKMIKEFMEKEEQIRQEIPESIVVSIFRINCKDVRKLYEGKYSEIVRGLTMLIVKKCRKQADTLSIKFDKMKEKISKDPKNIEELIQIKRDMEALPLKIEEEKKNIETLMDIYDIIEELSYKLTKEEMDLRWNVFARPKLLKELMESRKGYLDKKKEIFLQAMEEEQKSFLETITEHGNTVAMLSQYNNINDFQKNAEIVKAIDERLKECMEKAREYNNNESILDKETTDYMTQIKKIKQDFAPYYDLWTSAEIWLNKSKDWHSSDWAKMNAAEVDTVYTERYKTIALNLRFFKEKCQGPNQPKMVAICETLKKSLEDFKPYLPVIAALRHDGMKERHWKEISVKLQKEVNPKAEGQVFSLEKLVELGILNYQEFYEEVGEKSMREYKIELNLEKIEKEWKDVTLPIGAPPNNAKALIVLSFEKALQTLDDHIMLVQSMQTSIFKGPFKEKIEEWHMKLFRISDVLTEWSNLQVSWRYLQPIFDSPDIIQQLPNEASRFKGVDNIWTSLMKQTVENPLVITQCTKEGLLEKLQSATTNLEFIKKSLALYLEEKRLRFERFFFLADDDLLQILSQTKEVTEVQRYLMKVFENIAALNFTPEKIITAMYSSEKEKVDFPSTIDPTKSTVEYWLGDVERMMMASVRNELLKAIVAYKKKPRTEWCLQHPGQCVLTGSQIHWTHELETNVKKYGPKGPEKHLKFLNDQLKDTVKLVSRKLEYMQEVTMNALIVLDVHAKDVIETMAELKIGDLNDFEWMKQLRFYWENKECSVKCVQTCFPYGYEYIGNQSRLVITPLTDKCFMTLMGALKLNLGGAPAGPAGTGKTESVKDLAKGVAKQCVVFNCSEGLNYTDMAKFFKGLASSGAWCCFDEFNRINVEVLSVIAQQLKDLFTAKDLHLPTLNFEGSEIKIRDQFSVYITMNPGYAGRTELPDNLKALFRPMAMMVPDYSLIARIRLYSFGFQTASDLAKKMVTTFRLSSEQLSSQDHYDYGMRAVSTVINAAGMLRREDKQMNEDQLLLRALRDVNVPKFLKIDLPLFENIISDLFPGVKRPERDYGNLMESIKSSCKHFNVQPVEGFLHKVIQLYDTMNVRHGLMLVGPTGGGKTTTYRVLAKALTDLCDEKKFFKINYHILNPKAVTMGQLYGEFDPGTQEWIDGIMAMTVERCADDLSKERHWIIADGPVDSLWIENMNSVLDDNKKLCLTNGKIIKLSERINMIFEVEDLAVASPATVSRCGMVYEEPSIIGTKALFDSWLNGQDEKLLALPGFKQKLTTLFEAYTLEMIEWSRRNLKELVTTVDNNLACSLFRILDSFLINYIETESRKVTKEDKETMLAILPEMYVFATTWSLGATTTIDGRKEFDKKLRQILTEKLKMELPAEGTVYDYKLDIKTKLWVNWLKTIKQYELKASLENYLDILVPTTDSIRMIELLKMLVYCKKHVLTPGPTGTGKSVNINNMIGSGALGEDFQTFAMLFSAQTTANQAQDSIDEKMSRRRRGIYGADGGKKFAIFVDDLNMPKRQQYGAQPPIELLRQYMDHRGWFDLKEKKKPFRTIEDMVLLAAMGPPGGGRQPITQRLQRHFNIICYTFQQEETIRHIFSTILMAFMVQGKYPIAVRDSVPKIMEMTLHVYSAVLKQLLPMPSKSHYTFNLRDISKIFLGLCSAYIKTTNEDIDLIRLWVHENKRVFGDRLISQEDRDLLDNLLLTEIKSTFNYDRKKVFFIDRLLFADFLQGIDVDVRNYMPITDLKDMQKLLERILEDYNGTSGQKRQMKIIMFLDACEHVTRITRILRQPQGHALLLGVGGSGRQSLAKLSIYIANQKPFSIEVTKTYGIKNWREDLKKSVLKPAGIEEKRTSFLFVDTQIIAESMLEDINNIINSGDVPGIYAKDDKEEIERVGQSECQKRKLPLTQMNKWSMYFNRVKKNIHIILAMSPLSEEFRNRLRQFPALVSCCTIDWFTEWPAEALIGVARGNIIEKNITLDNSLDGVVEMFRYIHQSVETKSKKFLQIMRRHNYVTPTSYLEFMTLYGDILKKKRKENEMKQQRLKKGIDVLNDAKVKIEILQQTLNKQRPILEKTKEDIKITKEEIAKKTEEATKKKELVSTEQESAAKQEAEVSVLQAEAQKKLAEAEPILQQAITVLKKLQVGDFYVIKNLPHPPPAVYKVAEMMCAMFDIPPRPDKKTAEDPYGYFGAMKFSDQLLNNPNKMKEFIIGYDKDHIKESIVKRVVSLLNNPDITPEKVSKVSIALEGLYKWIDAMMKYHENLKMVTPLRIKVAEIQAKLNEVRAKLAALKKELEDLDEQLANLELDKARKIQEEKDLTASIEKCEKRLSNSQKLLLGLESEAVRWSQTIDNLKEEYQCLIADSLDSAAVVAYAGVFTAEYRRDLETEWIAKLDELNLKRSKDLTMVKVLKDDVRIREWNVAGLPSDSLSIENAIIAFEARRWPLMIDPQTQANKFIKKYGAKDEGSLLIFKASEGSIVKQLETAIELGQWVLLENIGEKLDPALEPLLQLQRIKKGESKTVNFGDKQLTYSEGFDFFLTTTLPNPHYQPEISVRVTLLNFAITPAGLEEQLLNLLVLQEMPELQDKKNRLVSQNAQALKDLQTIEDNILSALTKNKDFDSLIDDEGLINELGTSQAKATDIKKKREESEKTEKQIDETRQKYKPVAVRASLIFFCITDLSNVDSMYQYSLQWYANLFTMGIDNAPKSSVIDTRIKNIIGYFTESLYENVCRSLFERHKLLFSFMLCMKILFGNGEVDPQAWRYLLAGATGDIKKRDNPWPWIRNDEWDFMYRQFKGAAETLPHFKGIDQALVTHQAAFKEIFDSQNPHKMAIPGEYNEKLTDFEKMIVIKALRPDKICDAVQDYIRAHMGDKFTEYSTFNIVESYKDSREMIPLIFVLSAGSDPMGDWEKFADLKGVVKTKRDSVSLGQGQEKRADEMIRNGKENGKWVLLQNCHFAKSWMPKLEQIVESLAESNVHRDFRLWMTSMPADYFPVAVLQTSVKMTIEPPSGIRANLMRTFANMEATEIAKTKSPKKFQKLLYGFAFFHAIVQDRRKFGPIGWNIMYEFNNEDLKVCIRQMEHFIDNYPDVPFKDLKFLTSEINYGGRVTDDKDCRLIKVIVEDYITSQIFDDNYAFSKSGLYKAPPFTDKDGLAKFTSELPQNPNPEVFGMHENAEILTAQATTRELLETILNIQPRSVSGGGKTREQIILELVAFLEANTPKLFNLPEVQKQYQIQYTESMNTVLIQELIRYNKLIAVMGESMRQIKKALRGEEVMSEELERMEKSLFNNMVPDNWSEKGFLSLKPLNSWIKDLNDRVDFLNKWIANGTPSVFWISGFFFPQAFLTGTLQNYARRHQIAIDKLSFQFLIHDDKTPESIKAKPEDGCYVYGMSFEGARWNYDTHTLDDSLPKELYTPVPMIHFVPMADRKPPATGIYNCPVYKVLTRRGTLSTTGHSTNFVIFMEIPSAVDEKKWIKAGVAGFLALRY